MSTRVTSSRTTRDGLAVGVFLSALLVVGWVSANNLVVLVVAALLSLWLLSGLLGILNLRGVTVRRLLPDEAYVGQPVRMVYELRGPGPLPRFEIAVSERGTARSAAVCQVLLSGQSTAVSGSAVFSRRGPVRLQGITLRSGFPFRIVERQVDVDAQDEMWVFPEPLPGGVAVDGVGPGTCSPAGAPEDVADIRAYRPGDRIRDVHWPTTARVGRPMVVVRDRAATAPVWVEVREEPGVDWEQAISRATGAVLEASMRGEAVGLRAGHRAWPPRAGERWRRELLLALAALPKEPG